MPCAVLILPAACDPHQPPPLRCSWNYFANHINETVIMEMADAMVDTGLAAVGYEYINIVRALVMVSQCLVKMLNDGVRMPDT